MNRDELMSKYTEENNKSPFDSDGLPAMDYTHWLEDLLTGNSSVSLEVESITFKKKQRS